MPKISVSPQLSHILLEEGQQNGTLWHPTSPRPSTPLWDLGERKYSLENKHWHCCSAALFACTRTYPDMAKMCQIGPNNQPSFSQSANWVSELDSAVVQSNPKRFPSAKSQASFPFCQKRKEQHVQQREHSASGNRSTASCSSWT